MRIHGIWLPLIVIGVGGDVQMAVSVMKQGAFDFIDSPLETETLLGCRSGSNSGHSTARKPQLARAPGFGCSGPRAIEQDSRVRAWHQLAHSRGAPTWRAHAAWPSWQEPGVAMPGADATTRDWSRRIFRAFRPSGPFLIRIVWVFPKPERM